LIVIPIVNQLTINIKGYYKSVEMIGTTNYAIVKILRYTVLALLLFRKTLRGMKKEEKVIILFFRYAVSL
jgi:hypothetical protein